MNDTCNFKFTIQQIEKPFLGTDWDLFVKENAEQAESLFTRTKHQHVRSVTFAFIGSSLFGVLCEGIEILPGLPWCTIKARAKQYYKSA